MTPSCSSRAMRLRSLARRPRSSSCLASVKAMASLASAANGASCLRSDSTKCTALALFAIRSAPVECFACPTGQTIAGPRWRDSIWSRNGRSSRLVKRPAASAALSLGPERLRPDQRVVVDRTTSSPPPSRTRIAPRSPPTASLARPATRVKAARRLSAIRTVLDMVLSRRSYLAIVAAAEMTAWCLAAIANVCPFLNADPAPARATVRGTVRVHWELAASGVIRSVIDPALNCCLLHIQKGEGRMEYIRKVDFARLAATDERLSQPLLDHESGATSCTVS